MGGSNVYFRMNEICVMRLDYIPLGPAVRSCFSSQRRITDDWRLKTVSSNPTHVTTQSLVLVVPRRRSHRLPGPLVKVHECVTERGSWISVYHSVNKSKLAEKMVKRLQLLKQKEGWLELGCRSSWGQRRSSELPVCKWQSSRHIRTPAAQAKWILCQIPAL
jgi:hypothetical protein